MSLFTEKNRPDPKHETTRFPICTPAQAKIAGYKIRRKRDGKYSTGGGHPEFTSVGKTWSTVGTLHGHFAVIREMAGYEWRSRQPKGETRAEYEANAVGRIYAGCEIVELAEIGVEEIK